MGKERGEGELAKCAPLAERHFRDAERLFGESVGKTSPLYQTAARCISQTLLAQGKQDKAEPWLRKALEVEAMKDGVHPTPLHEMVEELVGFMTAGGAVDVEHYHMLLEQAIQNLEKHNWPQDGNLGMVLHKVARVFLLSGEQYFPAALGYLQQALQLIQSHDDSEADTAFHCSLIEMEIDRCKASLGCKPLRLVDKAGRK